MKKTISLWTFPALLGIGSAYGVGDYPVPQITDVTFDAQAAYDVSTGRFTYQYHIASGPDNIGTISIIYLDITRRHPTFDPVPADFSYSVPKGKEPTQDVMNFFLRYADLPHKVTIETVATDLPQYWDSNPTRDGDLAIATPSGGGVDENGVKRPAYRISPGDSFSGLTVVGLSPPTLREVIISPDWRLIVENEAAVTAEIRTQADQLAQDLLIKRFTIGPKRINFTGSGLHDRLAKDIDKMVELGWIIDLALIGSVRALLNEAKIFLLNADGTQAKVKYQQAIDLMAPVTETQMRREAIDLIQINLQLKLEFTPDTTIIEKLALVVEPEDSQLEIVQVASFTPKLVDRARDDIEVPIFFDLFTLEVLSGPHVGLIIQGQASDLNYFGTKVGTDIVGITRMVIPTFVLDEDESAFEVQARVVWTGGPDYVISFFSPPFLDYQGSETIWIYEETKNIGTTAGKESSNTRYYLSATPNFNISSAYQLFERTVVPLAVDAESKSGATELIWPSQFPPGLYYFAACVDANNVIAELNEDNNCSFHQVDRVAYVVGVMGEEPFVVNTPPSCDQAVASLDTLWPPNHKFKNISIDGVIDVDQDEVLITITGITQDEAVDSISSGNTSPDGKGVGTTLAQVRAEREGTGDGRVYAIHFKATDSAGNECTGVVNTSSVVHDQSNRSLPAVDSGQVYDSTIEFN